ncbi:DUF2851 family protein [Aureibacter tunicatorum]|uniref:DUF2851 family protein n=1 Tax=Aureibacter tunicatorum TaxID=866807 RepID=A0AAE4BUM6_9BACT|nr:DUF2851 family protein [Aureibacter tunicatorum]MDR6240928.1 hypothetical protein [Aureibacter tunicatorum]BDD03708.1 hypothetical protein AUTU_11910 [Aureibacter tunicatorum]
MKEDLLYHLWQYQKFAKHNLRTVQGDELRVFSAGHLNTLAGPDFAYSKIMLNDVTWSGSVEIHVNSSDWYRHKHHLDENYEKVILHVVWNNDKEVKLRDGSLLPVLELKNRVYPEILEKYEKMMGDNHDFTCRNLITKVPDIKLANAFESALNERLRTKASKVSEVYKSTNQFWEETAFKVICSAFGFKVNSGGFGILAEQLRYDILQKNRDQRLKIEALFFGLSGMIREKNKDEYSETMKRYFSFLDHKYSLGGSMMSERDWNFFGARPANFPTLRLAQLAGVVCKSQLFFDAILNSDSLKDYYAIFEFEISDYWKSHYDFGKKKKSATFSLSKASKENLIINSVIPILAAYAMEKDQHQYWEKAIDLLSSLSPERNSITKKWNAMGVELGSAFETQACLEQYKHHCLEKKCLSCSVGYHLLHSHSSIKGNLSEEIVKN